MMKPECPSCSSIVTIKSGIIKERQRYMCKKCKYYFTVSKLGKKIDDYYVIKALQLYLEGISYREIERILGISHVSVMKWVKKYHVIAPNRPDYHPTYKVLNHQELIEYVSNISIFKSSGMVISELGDKFMLIKLERFRTS